MLMCVCVGGGGARMCVPVHPTYDCWCLPCTQLLEYDQSEFFAVVPELVSMDSTGYVYVPTSCQDLSGTVECVQQRHCMSLYSGLSC